MEASGNYSCFKEGIIGSVNEYRLVPVNHFSILFEFVIHVTLKVIPCLHDFAKSNSIILNQVTHILVLLPL
jgi:hypothetical protein